MQDKNFNVRTYATQAWADATFAVYPSLGGELWIRLDDVTLKRTPAEAISGTDCIEPGGGPEPSAIKRTGTRVDAAVSGASGIRTLRSGEAAVTTGGQAQSRRFKVRLEAETSALVQVSRDGVNWITVFEIAPTASATTVEIDLSAVAGGLLYVRLIVERGG